MGTRMPDLPVSGSFELPFDNKRYHTLNNHLRRIFGAKVFKVPLDAGFTCPNRDGTKGHGGCSFCSAAGSGDFAGDRQQDITGQFQQVTEIMHRKWPSALYIAYYQAFTNTYAPVDRLYNLYQAALDQPGVVGISVATRPDCLANEVLDLLQEFQNKTYLWLEIGLQTIHAGTSRAMNIGYDVHDFRDAVRRARDRGLRVCPHIILGLPGESREMMMETARAVLAMDVQGIKIHLLHLMRGTPLEKLYDQGKLEFMTQDEYVQLIVDILEILPPTMVVHRLTGDSPRDLLIGPDWSLKKWEVLNAIDRELSQRDSWQGKYYTDSADGLRE
ncbi:MAG: TIGR01212 family radical SAM protein [Acidobacteriota bacterium]